MFEINEQDLPLIRTRQALLVLDMQNDLVSTGCLLPVEKPPKFVERIVDLASHFRGTGDVIWIRTQFVTSRPVNSPYGESESVITDHELPTAVRDAKDTIPHSSPSRKLLERHSKIAASIGRSLGEDNEDNEDEEISQSETFLTVEPGQKPRAVQPFSPGTNFTQHVGRNVDGKKDLIYQKSYYSAFKDGTLVQILRGKFVTEIYLCGALTNISIFATAMDAARHGYAITLVDDCLGYRSKERHDEAIRQLTEFTGCDLIDSGTLTEILEGKLKPQKSTPARHKRPSERAPDLETSMANLQLGGVDRAPSKSHPATVTAGPSGASATAGAGSTESHLLNQESKLLAATETEGKKRERVKSKLKVRRRPSRSGPKDVQVAVGQAGLSEIKPVPISPISATLRAASQALEKVKIGSGDATETDTAASEGVLPGNIGAVQPLTTTEKVGGTVNDQVAATGGQAVAASADLPIDLGTKFEMEPTVFCEGDSKLIKNLLEDELAGGIFEMIRDELRWQKMSHQGGDVPRLVAVQGEIEEDGSLPIYRHPADESPPLSAFSPTVSLIRKQVEEKLGHHVNHVLIQFYRDGTDYISEHSDKTLDIVPNTYIANVSLGAQRTMAFRTKKSAKQGETSAKLGTPTPRSATRVPLPHNSMCRVGLATNRRWLHGIRQDKRVTTEKSEAELSYNGERISLTFRLIGTFLDKDQQKIWGQGATEKNKENARTVINGNTAEAEKMIKAFGKENQSTEFDWEAVYGEGFDVLHISNSPKLFLSGDDVADLRVKLMLAEYGILWTEGKLSSAFNWKDGHSSSDAPPVPQKLPIKFLDNDLSKSTVTGDLAIMLYLKVVYGVKLAGGTHKREVDLARQFTRFQQCNNLLEKWRAIPFCVKPFRRELELWNTYAAEGDFIAGSIISLADYCLLPILNEIAKEWADGEGLSALETYYHRLLERPTVKALGFVHGHNNMNPVASHLIADEAAAIGATVSHNP